jgi:hypothetical protein
MRRHWTSRPPGPATLARAGPGVPWSGRTGAPVGVVVASVVGRSVGAWVGRRVRRGVGRAVAPSVGPTEASWVASDLDVPGVADPTAVRGVGVGDGPPRRPPNTIAAPARAATRTRPSPAATSHRAPLPPADATATGRGDPATVPTAGSSSCPQRWQNVLPGGLRSPHVRQGTPPMAGGGNAWGSGAWGSGAWGGGAWGGGAWGGDARGGDARGCGARGAGGRVVDPGSGTAGLSTGPVAPPSLAPADQPRYRPHCPQNSSPGWFWKAHSGHVMRSSKAPCSPCEYRLAV